MSLIQNFINLYPDSVSEFGLLGCLWATVTPISALATLWCWGRYFLLPRVRGEG